MSCDALTRSSNYEGGVRGVGFLHWTGLPNTVRGTVSHRFMHVADWLPTLVHGVAQLEVTSDGYKYPVC